MCVKILQQLMNILQGKGKLTHTHIYMYMYMYMYILVSLHVLACVKFFCGASFVMVYLLLARMLYNII